MYQKIFPLGDSSKYAGLVFKSIDQNQTGAVTFGDFMDFLSMLTKGSVEEKMLWSFHFYDVNKDGYISREEMIKVINGRLNFLSRASNMMKQKKMMPNKQQFIHSYGFSLKTSPYKARLQLSFSKGMFFKFPHAIFCTLFALSSVFSLVLSFSSP